MLLIYVHAVHDFVGNVCVIVCVFRHSLLDAKINSALSLCHDQATLGAVQRIIENTILMGDASQQQPSYLQSELLLFAFF